MRDMGSYLLQGCFVLKFGKAAPPARRSGEAGGGLWRGEHSVGSVPVGKCGPVWIGIRHNRWRVRSRGLGAIAYLKNGLTVHQGALEASAGGLIKVGDGATTAASVTLDSDNGGDISLTGELDIGAGNTLTLDAPGFGGFDLFCGPIGDGTLIIDNASGTIDSNFASRTLILKPSSTGSVNEGGALVEAENSGKTSIVSVQSSRSTFTNDGRIEALLGTVAFGNLNLPNISGGVLTGGTWEASGRGAWLSFWAGFSSDAATIILDYAGSVNQSVGSGRASTLESQLTDVAASGVLEVLDQRSYATTPALTLEGALQLGGGAFTSAGISAAAGSTLTGFGRIGGFLTERGFIVMSATGEAFLLATLDTGLNLTAANFHVV